MNDNPSPSERAAAEAGRPSPVEPPVRASSTSQIARFIILALTIAILTMNVWLVARLMQQQSEATKEHLFWVLCQPGGTPGERANAFRRLVAEGNKEWRSAQLSELDLSGIPLPGAEIKGAGFQRANFAGANLAGAHLSKSSLELADLTGADLSQADLAETQFYRATLSGAKLNRAILRAALLQEVKAEKVELMVADLSDADCLMANLAGANLAGANLTGARLEAAILKDSNLSLARLNGANLKDADFANSNWWRARGLSTAQVDLLKKSFAPTDNAPRALKEDYQKWTSTRTQNPEQH